MFSFINENPDPGGTRTHTSRTIEIRNLVRKSHDKRSNEMPYDTIVIPRDGKRETSRCLIRQSNRGLHS